MPERVASALFRLRKFYPSNYSREFPGVSIGASDWHVHLEFDCSNIHEINITRELGRGTFKTAFLGVYSGKTVVVKMVTDKSPAFAKCVGELDMTKWERRCHSLPTMHIMKEILLLLQLRHRNFLDLLGFCVRGDDIRSRSLKEHGVIAVYEYGDMVNVSHMGLWPLSRRLDTAIQLLDLVIYAEHSPLGSLRLGDMKLSNFLFVGPSIKFSDADLVTAQERCVETRCLGYNAKFNLMRIHRLFLTTLLRSAKIEEETQTSFGVIEAVNSGLRSVRSELNILNVTTSSNSTDIYRKLIDIRDMLET